MTTVKKVFIGSLFEFTSAGAGEILSGVRDQYADPESVPFVSYDRNTKLFSCEVESDDHTLIPLLNTQIETYVTLHRKESHQPFDSDKLAPIEGTVIHDESSAVRVRDEKQPQLLDIGLSSEDEEGGTGSGDSAVYWKPKSCDTTILTADIAHEIADLTGTWLVRHPVEPKIELRQGNVQLALEKLQNLEDMLSQTGAHRSRAGAHVDANLHLLYSGPESRIKFVRPVDPLCGFDRIFLDPAQISRFHQIMASEVRIWQDTRRVKPLNLDLEGVSLTAKHGPATGFDRSRMPILGNPKNAEPRSVSKDNSQASGDIQRPGSPTKYLGQKDKARVIEWRGNIDPNAGPNVPAEAPVPDEEKVTGRRRVAIESSDEEDSDDNKNFRSETKTTVSVTQQDVETQIAEHKEQGHSKWFTEPKASQQKANPRNSPTMSHASLTQGKGNSTRQAKQPPRSALSKTQVKSSNMYDLIGFDENEEITGPHDSTADVRVSDISEEKVKQFNVTFEDPIPWNGTTSMSKPSSPWPQDSIDRPEFDASKYGVKKHHAKAQSRVSRTHASHAHSHSTDTRSNPVSPMPGPPRGPAAFSSHPHKGEVHSRRGDHWARTNKAPDRRNYDLIDITPDDLPETEHIMPPPGFDYRSNALADPPPSPIACYQQAQSSVSQRTPAVNEQASSSAETSESSDPRHAFNDFTPQFIPPRRNINFMKDQAAARLRAQMKSSIRQDTSGSENNSSLPPNRILKDDELGSRKYHDTMSQKMAKPAKIKQNAGKQESKAEREARIAKAKAEAYGDTASAKHTPSKSHHKPQIENLPSDTSARKRQLLKKDPAMADLHQDVVVDIVNKDTALKLAEKLNPILQATRAFKGVIKVEIQLGQALTLAHSRISEASVYSSKDWTQLLNGQKPSDPKVIFTNILTSNGQDLDRMLETKADVGSGKLWDKGSPGISSLNFEFSCQDKSGQDFLLVLDHDGNYSLEKAPATIGQVAIHAPAQIWDACAVVSGTMEYLRPTEEVKAGAEQFKESLYSPGGRKAAIYYRLPPNNAFTIKAIIMKRVSLHDCLSTKKEDIQLRVTEVKALAHSSNPTDKKLYRSYESSYEVMVNEGRIHYEVAIVDKSIEKIYDANPDIEIGDLIPDVSPNGNMLSQSKAQTLIEVTSYMLERIDWAGGHNVGTLRRLQENAAGQRASLANALPPGITSNLPIPMGRIAPPTVVPTTYQSQITRTVGGDGGATNIGGTSTNPDQQVLLQLHGIRARTAAELFQDPISGDLFYYGQGGARVPVAADQVEGLRFDSFGPVFPGDSASQIGDVVKKRTGGAGMSTTGKKSGWDEKPAGFW